MKALRRCVANGIYLVLMISFLMAILMSIFTRPILQLFNTPANILDDACVFLTTVFVFAFCLLIYSLLIGYMRALGDSRTPLFFLILACVLNVALDLLFIAVLHTGVEGVAYATAISQLLASLVCLRTIRKHIPILWLTKEDLKPSLHEMAKLCRIAVPMGLQFSFVAIGSILIQSAINSLGSDAVAATSAVGKVQGVLLAPLDASGISIATFTSQNYGAKRLDRVRTGVKQSILVFSAYCVFALVISYFFGSHLAEIFLKRSEVAIHALISQQLLLVSFFYIPLALIYIYRNALQGLGCSNAVMTTGILETVGRAFVSLLLVAPFGFTAVCLASPVAWVLAVFFLLPMYAYTMRRLGRSCSIESPE